jgi:DNA (cytosine-5)-methyltransferase 1
MQSKFKFLDLFSGIGGFHSALDPLGGECVMASDIHPAANKTYYLNYGIHPVGDIKEIKTNAIPKFDLLCAGFPCQSFSNVGQKGGLNDTRGELVYEIFRILEDKQPKAFILENVKGLLSHDRGNTISFIIATLEKLNYKVQYKILEAKDYGLPQIRKRLFIVGVHKSINKTFEFPEPFKLKYTLAKVMGGKVEREFAFTVRIGGRRSGINNRYNWDSYVVDGSVRYITPEECLLLQGFKKSFKLSGNEGEKYFQVGNTVPVTVVNAIAKKLIEIGVI